MEMRRRDALAVGAAALAAGAVGPAGAAAPNPLAAFIAPDRRSIRVLRVTSAPGGGAAVETVSVPATEPYGNIGLTQFLERKATRFAVYAAPPGHQAEPEASSDLLLVVKGSAAVKAGAQPAPCPAGTLLLLEAPAALLAGPDGYTAIKVRLA